MSNELAGLTELSRGLFGGSFTLLGWFCKNYDPSRFKVAGCDRIVRRIRMLKKDTTPLFGNSDELKEANQHLLDFYKTVKPAGTPDSNKEALEHFINAWHSAWANRASLDLRGLEITLMRYFYEIFQGLDHIHLPELVSMARLFGRETVKIARLVNTTGPWSPKKAFAQRTEQMFRYQKKLFGLKLPTIAEAKRAKKRRPKLYKEYTQIQRHRKHVAQMLLVELFDQEGWFPTTDSRTLRKKLKQRALEEFLPETFIGKVGVQPNGYPLVFYTAAGLELEKPPLNGVKMNENYGKKEEGKEYKIHPTKDGTFYCETTALVGDSKLKYYTMEYKRRARQIKYDQVKKLENAIKNVRAKMLKDIKSKDRDTWVRATMCLFIDARYARIGNVDSARANNTFGLTTLQTKKHVRIKDNKIIIRYYGKHSQLQKHTFRLYKNASGKKAHPVSAAVAEKLLILIKEGKKHLFTRSDGKPFTPQQVNEYFRASKKAGSEKSLPQGGPGAPCTVHCLRNLHATRLFKEFAKEFAKTKNPTYQDALIAYQGCAETKSRQEQKGILDNIAKKLGNTPAICRKSYIDPADQLLFFKQLGYRPPNALVQDVFENEEEDTYGTGAQALKNAKKRVKAA
jgi:DNA topoisomerase IB